MQLPSEFIERMKNLLGSDADDFLNALQTPSPVSIRINPRKMKSENSSFLAPLLSRQVAWCSEGFYLSERPLFTSDPQFHAGAYYVQEASSMFIARILRQILTDQPVRVLDLCAAPGGKSTLIASMLPEDSLLVSNEVIRQRASILRENIIKWGHDNIIVTGNDPADFSPFKGAFDIVLVDAPCSGEGMFRKDERAIEEWTPANAQLCADRQRRILSDIWDSVRPDGYLIYSTCTYNPAEDEDMVEWLTERDDAEYIPVTTLEEGITSARYGYHFYPHLTTGEGFYVALIHKTDGEEFYCRLSKNRRKEKAPALPSQITALLPSKDLAVYTSAETLGVIPATHAPFIEALEQHLRILYKGCEVVEINGKKIKPLHPLALYTQLLHENAEIYELDRETALHYLKKESIPASASADWQLVTYGGISLGWGKNVGNRLNNYFPKEWRIRMSIDNC